MDDDDKQSHGFGDPVSMLVDCEFLDSVKVTIKCGECGKGFRFPLENEAIKICPGCGTKYSHALLIARADDTEAISEFCDLIEPSDEGIDVDESDESDELLDEESDEK